MTLASLDHEWRGELLLARLEGEIDMSNAEELHDALTALTPNSAIALVLDLSAVEYLDSAGIQLLYRLREGLSRRGQELRLAIPEHSSVNDTLRLAGIGRDASTFSSVADACAPTGPSTPGPSAAPPR
jgi:anti-sigma B factor antagonist